MRAQEGEGIDRAMWIFGGSGQDGFFLVWRRRKTFFEDEVTPRLNLNRPEGNARALCLILIIHKEIKAV